MRQRQAAAPQRVHVLLQLGADDRELAERRVQHALLRARVALQHEAEHRHEHQQQREQREEPVVRDQRPQLDALVVVELLQHRHENASARWRCWKRSTALRPRTDLGGGSVGRLVVRHACVSTRIRVAHVAPRSLSGRPSIGRAAAFARLQPSSSRSWRAPRTRGCCAPTATACGARTWRTATARPYSSCSRARARGRRFSSREHLANALEQRFLSRVLDRRRAVAGRSPMQPRWRGRSRWVARGSGRCRSSTRGPRSTRWWPFGCSYTRWPSSRRC